MNRVPGQSLPGQLARTFDFNGRALRVFGTSDAPLFVAKDVCDGLDLENVSRACERLDDDESGMSEIHTPSGLQSMLVVTESGLYSLVLRSDKPAAKAFRRWVTHEVLPAIRRTGGYGVPGVDAQTAWSIAKDAVLQLPSLPPRQGIAMIRVAETITGRQLDLWNLVGRGDETPASPPVSPETPATQPAAAAPPVNLPYRPRQTPGSMSAADVGKLLGISARSVGWMARRSGIRTDPECCVPAYRDHGVTRFRFTALGVAKLRAQLAAETGQMPLAIS